jgi:hypothetical protein
MITPNLCNDGHDEECVDDKEHPGGLPKINAWLKREIPKILSSPGYKDDGMVIITYDEAESADTSACCNEQPGPSTPNPGGLNVGPGGGRIGAVVLSPFVQPNTVVSGFYNHYSLLRSVEDLYGLGHLGYAGQAGLKPFGSDLYNRTPKLTLKVSPKRIRQHKRRTLRIRVNRPAKLYFGGRCKRRPRTVGLSGKRRLKVRLHHSGRCRVLAKRKGWKSARARVRVLKRHR